MAGKPVVHQLNRRKGRPTVAFLSSVLGLNLYQQKGQIWSGIERVCREQDVNLLYVAGGEVDTAPESILYELISARAVDGILSWTGAVLPQVRQEKAAHFLKQYAPLPVVNVGWQIPGIPTVGFDQALGMRDLLAHLVEVHGKHNIAYMYYGSTLNFVKESSFNGYVETMQSYGLYRPELVAYQTASSPDFFPLQPVVDYQAAVCTTDTEAIGLMRLLERQQIRVPEDLAVTGIHDSQESRVAVPPLTTSRIPFYKGGKRAAELLIEILAGREVPEYSLLPLDLIVRQSCGCTDDRFLLPAAEGSRRSKESFAKLAARERLRILAEMAGSIRFSDDLDPGWAARLFDTFLSDVLASSVTSSRQPKAFLRELRAIMRGAANAGVDFIGWQKVISTLRGRLVPLAGRTHRDTAEDLWQQARILIGQEAARSETRQFLSLAEQTQTLSAIETALHLARDIDMLGSILENHLPALGITECLVSLYENPACPEGDARLVLAICESGRVSLPAGGICYPALELAPQAFLPAQYPFSFAIESLQYLDENLGFVLFGSREGKVSEIAIPYEALRRQISSALKGIWLLEQIDVARRQAEESDQLKSQFLSMVSHELRTPLNLIVGLCEMAEWKQTHSGINDPGEMIQLLKHYLSQIHASAQHLDWLIRDVLDLASSQVGQLHLTSEPLDLSAMLRETAAMGEKMAQSKQLTWILNIPENLPCIMGDRARIRQVILNMLSNAVKFTAHGEVELGASFTGGDVTVFIRDTGVGVPLDEQSAIFDEFRQSERTASRGYGGTGLGLAITRKLVEMHGGKVGVDSPGTEGGGSTFYFTLPILRQEEAPGAPLLSEPHTNIVLLCHSGEKNEQLIRELTDQGFVLDTWIFENREGWLGFVLERQPVAVILDCSPQNEEGWVAMKALKENPGTQGIPVLFYALMEEQDHGLVFSMDLLNKPVQKSDLKRLFELYQLHTWDPENDRSILVADDEPGILAVHAQMVAELLPGYRVLVARDGRQAWKIIQEDCPDLVLLDLMMPEMNGFAVLEAMQVNSSTRSIPVVILTGQTLTEWEMSQLSQRVSSILSKGIFTTEETLAHLRAALANDHRLGSEAQRLARMAMAYIHTHYQEPVSRTEIARHLGMDEDYLTRCFKREVGLSPVTYLNRYRIHQARQLLEQGGNSIVDVALQVGFTSQSYFTRVFQNEVGVSPKAYQSGQRKT